MSAALDLSPRRRLPVLATWPLRVVDPRPGWEKRVRELFAVGALEEARAIVDRFGPGEGGSRVAKWREILSPARVVRTSPASGGTAAAADWMTRPNDEYRGKWVFLDREGAVVDADIDVKVMSARHSVSVRRQWTLIRVEP